MIYKTHPTKYEKISDLTLIEPTLQNMKKSDLTLIESTLQNMKKNNPIYYQQCGPNINQRHLKCVLIDYDRVNQLIDHEILASIIYLIDQISILIDFLINPSYKMKKTFLISN